jgi:hypothetical protein
MMMKKIKLILNKDEIIASVDAMQHQLVISKRICNKFVESVATEEDE